MKYGSNFSFNVMTLWTDCNQEALESMGDRLLDWFSVVMADTQKRKLNRRNRSNQGMYLSIKQLHIKFCVQCRYILSVSAFCACGYTKVY